MFEKIFDEIKTNLKNPQLYIFLLVGILLTLLFFPYIDANIFYYKRVKNRIDILTQISLIDIKSIQNNEILISEYQNILLEIEKQSKGSLGSVFIKETNKNVNNWKFISGGFLFWIIAIACLFMNTFKTTTQKWGGLVLVAILGVIFGFLGKVIPTIINPWVNYIGFPLLILLIICLLATTGSKKKSEDNENG